MMKQQIWYVGGGDSFNNTEEFHTHLRSVELWHMNPEGVGTGWTNHTEETLKETHDFFKIPMPNRENADYEAWKIWFERHFDHMKGEPVFIGLSLGAMFLAKYLSENELPVKARHVYLLAGAYDIETEPLEGSGNFLVKPATVRTVTDKYPVMIMHSKDDFVVPFKHGEALAEALPEAEFVAFSDKNHFLIEEFPELVERIKAL